MQIINMKCIRVIRWWALQENSTDGMIMLLTGLWLAKSRVMCVRGRAVVEALRCPIHHCLNMYAECQQCKRAKCDRKWRSQTLTAVLFVWVVSAVILAVTPPAVWNAVVVLAEEIMRSAGLSIFFIRSKQTRRWKWLQRAWILILC